MVRVVIQIPCFNEAGQLAATVAALPARLPGVDVLDVLVVDDGSTDGTAEVARSLGIAHVLRLQRHRGLAFAFKSGLEAAVRLDADVIVNVDADNQYCADDIGSLVTPILRGDADLVVGARPIAQIDHFSATRKVLQRVGSAVVRRLSGVDVPDATSGFRALSRETALRINVFSRYTYTLEMLIQAGQRRLVVGSVPIRVNPPTRASRLFASPSDYIVRAVGSMLHAFIVYRPLRFFLVPASVLFGVGAVLVLRFLYFYATSDGASGHIQSLILAAIFVMLAGLLVVAGILAELLAINRRLLEEIQTAERRREWRVGADAGLDVTARIAHAAGETAAPSSPVRRRG